MCKSVLNEISKGLSAARSMEDEVEMRETNVDRDDIKPLHRSKKLRHVKISGLPLGNTPRNRGNLFAEMPMGLVISEDIWSCLLRTKYIDIGTPTASLLLPLLSKSDAESNPNHLVSHSPVSKPGPSH